jgi:hypothetical protein
MAVKRRTIWLSDEEWADIESLAKKDGLTVSRAIARQFDELLCEEYVPRIETAPFVELTPDVIQFRPVPKPGK